MTREPEILFIKVVADDMEQLKNLSSVLNSILVDEIGTYNISLCILSLSFLMRYGHEISYCAVYHYSS